MAVIKMNFLSQALGMQTNITICLPTYSFADAVADRREVYVPGMKYQVLWLLHGGSGDDSDYLNFSNIARYADENKIAVVMPAGYDSFYTNWHEGCDGAQYYTYITEELFHTLPILFPFSTKREDNFVAGLSMGSHGAMKIAINHPERYAAALIMSGSAIRPKNIAQGLDTVAEHSGPLPTILKRITRLQQNRERRQRYRSGKSAKRTAAVPIFHHVRRRRLRIGGYKIRQRLSERTGVQRLF